MTYLHGICLSVVFVLWICADAISNYAVGVFA